MGMSWWSDLIGKGMDKVWPDKAEARRQQTELNKAEIEKAPASRLLLWRPLLMTVLTYLFAYEVVIRPWVLVVWPNVKIPPSYLKEIVQMLLFSLGGAY
jgi:hypothetical protein